MKPRFSPKPASRADAPALQCGSGLGRDLIDRHLDAPGGRARAEPQFGARPTRAISASFSSTAATDRVEPAALDARALISGYLEALARRGMSVASQRRHLASIRGLAREMVEQKIVEHDPAPRSSCGRIRGRSRARLAGATSRCCSTRSTPRYFAAMRDRAMLEMAYGCGLRVSELVGLQSWTRSISRSASWSCWARAARSGSCRSGRRAMRALKAYLAAREDRSRDNDKRAAAAAVAGVVHQPARACDDAPGIFQGAQGMDRRAIRAWRGSVRIRCATASRPICWKAAPICARCRRCSVTATSRPRRFTRICPRAICARSIARFIRARRAPQRAEDVLKILKRSERRDPACPTSVNSSSRFRSGRCRPCSRSCCTR